MENSWVTKARSALMAYSPGDLLALADLHDGFLEVGKRLFGKELSQAIEICCEKIANQLSVGSYELDASFLKEISELLNRIENEPQPSENVNEYNAGSDQDNFGESDYLEVFHIELHDRITQSQDLILEIEKTADESACQELFRIFHTVKGEAGFLRIQWIQELFHSLESLLDALRKKELNVSNAVVSVLFEGLDLTQTYLEKGSVAIPVLEENKNRIAKTVDSLLRRGLENGEQSSSVSSHSLQKDQFPSEQLDRSTTTKANESLIKVSGSKLSKLYELVSEMLILQDQLKEEEKVVRQLRKVSREVQQAAMNLSTVPLKPLFVKMKRAVRDLSKQLGKQVEVVVEGDSIELDRTLMEALEEPLIHLVRNCISHGVEGSDIRRARNKPASGTIKLCGELRGNRIVLTIRDDGEGLARDKIILAAIKNELISSEHAAELTDKEVYELIFRDGLSTAEKLNDVSGRGIGMSIVKKTVERFRGNLEIETDPEKFTAFHLIFPLSSALIDGVMVEVSHGKYILPVESVLESIVVKPEHMKERENGMSFLLSRGSFLPVFDLAKLFFGSKQEPDNEVPLGVVVETTLGQRCVFLVRKVLDKKEFVIKPLGTRFKSLQGVSAAAILRGGEIGFLLDIDGVTTLS